MAIYIGLPSSIATPPSGQIQEFFDTTSGTPVHSYMDEFRAVHLWPTDDVPGTEEESCACEIAEDTMKKLACALEEGTITATDFQNIIQMGISITDNETNNGAGTTTSTLSIGASRVPVSGITVSPTTINPLAVSAQRAIVPTVSPANATNKTVIWSSSNVTHATVDQNGIVTGVATGTATITATTADGLFTATCVVTVP